MPIAIGFGIRTPEQVASATLIGDGAVVASALIQTLAANLDDDGVPRPGLVEKILDQVKVPAAAVSRSNRVE